MKKIKIMVILLFSLSIVFSGCTNPNNNSLKEGVFDEINNSTDGESGTVEVNPKIIKDDTNEGSEKIEPEKLYGYFWATHPKGKISGLL